MDYPVLEKSYKGCFPFRLSTTSFIYPDGYARNVQMLAPYVDEIELLLFESRSPQCLPPPSEIRQLRRMADTHDLSYSVHLPIDIHPGSPDPVLRRQAVAAVRNALAVTAELEARSYILHLPCSGISEEDKDLDAWQDFSRQSLQAIFDGAGPMGRICIENLDYPIWWYAPLLKTFGLKMCLDVGHLVCQRIAPISALKHYRETISVIHLHGVENGRDHLALGPDRGIDMPSLVKLLQDFRESVCIEVFAYTHLADSLTYFEKHWKRAVESASEGCAARSTQITQSDWD